VHAIRSAIGFHNEPADDDAAGIDLEAVLCRCDRWLCSAFDFPVSPSLGLDDAPSATTEFTGELFRRQQRQELLLGGFPPRGRSDGSTPFGFRLLELGDEVRCLVAREFAPSLTLAKSHWASRIAKVGMSGFLEKTEELPHLGRRSGWT
jgi:hypothetical protein